MSPTEKLDKLNQQEAVPDTGALDQDLDFPRSYKVQRPELLTHNLPRTLSHQWKTGTSARMNPCRFLTGRPLKDTEPFVVIPNLASLASIELPTLQAWMENPMSSSLDTIRESAPIYTAAALIKICDLENAIQQIIRAELTPITGAYHNSMYLNLKLATEDQQVIFESPASALVFCNRYRIYVSNRAKGYGDVAISTPHQCATYLATGTTVQEPIYLKVRSLSLFNKGDNNKERYEKITLAIYEICYLLDGAWCAERLPNLISRFIFEDLAGNTFTGKELLTELSERYKAEYDSNPNKLNDLNRFVRWGIADHLQPSYEQLIDKYGPQLSQSYEVANQLQASSLAFTNTTLGGRSAVSTVALKNLSGDMPKKLKRAYQRVKGSPLEAYKVPDSDIAVPKVTKDQAFIHLPILDQMQRKELPTAADYIKRHHETDLSASEATALLRMFDNHYEYLISKLEGHCRDFIAAGLYREDQEITTTLHPDLKLVDQQDHIIFENLTQYFVFIHRLRVYHYQQHQELAKHLDCQPLLPEQAASPIVTMYRALAKHWTPQQAQRLESLAKEYELRPKVILHLKALNKFPDILDPQQQAVAASNALAELSYYYFGGLPYADDFRVEVFQNSELRAEDASISIDIATLCELSEASEDITLSRLTGDGVGAAIRVHYSPQFFKPNTTPSSEKIDASQLTGRMPEKLHRAKAYGRDRPLRAFSANKYRKRTESDVCIHSDAIDYLFNNPPKLASHLDVNHTHDYLDYEGAAKYLLHEFDKEYSKIFGMLYSLVDILIEEGLITDLKSLTTASLPDLKIIDQEGRVIFENLGQYFVFISDLDNYYQLEKASLARTHGLAKQRPTRTTPISKVYATAAGSSIDHENACLELFEQAIEERSVDLQLRMLNGYQDIQDPKVKAERALLAIIEASYYYTGGIPTNTNIFRAIQSGTRFKSTNDNTVVSFDELYEIITSEDIIVIAGRSNKYRILSKFYSRERFEAALATIAHTNDSKPEQTNGSSTRPVNGVGQPVAPRSGAKIPLSNLNKVLKARTERERAQALSDTVIEAWHKMYGKFPNTYGQAFEELKTIRFTDTGEVVQYNGADLLDWLQVLVHCPGDPTLNLYLHLRECATATDYQPVWLDIKTTPNLLNSDRLSNAPCILPPTESPYSLDGNPIRELQSRQFKSAQAGQPRLVIKGLSHILRVRHVRLRDNKLAHRQLSKAERRDKRLIALSYRESQKALMATFHKIFDELIEARILTPNYFSPTATPRLAIVDAHDRIIFNSPAEAFFFAHLATEIYNKDIAEFCEKAGIPNNYSFNSNPFRWVAQKLLRLDPSSEEKRRLQTMRSDQFPVLTLRNWTDVHTSDYLEGSEDDDAMLVELSHYTGGMLDLNKEPPTRNSIRISSDARVCRADPVLLLRKIASFNTTATIPPSERITATQSRLVARLQGPISVTKGQGKAPQRVPGGRIVNLENYQNQLPQRALRPALPKEFDPESPYNIIADRLDNPPVVGDSAVLIVPELDQYISKILPRASDYIKANDRIGHLSTEDRGDIMARFADARDSYLEPVYLMTKALIEHEIYTPDNCSTATALDLFVASSNRELIFDNPTQLYWFAKLADEYMQEQVEILSSRLRVPSFGAVPLASPFAYLESYTTAVSKEFFQAKVPRRIYLKLTDNKSIEDQESQHVLARQVFEICVQTTGRLPDEHLLHTLDQGPYLVSSNGSISGHELLHSLCPEGRAPTLEHITKVVLQAQRSLLNVSKVQLSFRNLKKLGSGLPDVLLEKRIDLNRSPIGQLFVGPLRKLGNSEASVHCQVLTTALAQDLPNVRKHIALYSPEQLNDSLGREVCVQDFYQAIQAYYQLFTDFQFAVTKGLREANCHQTRFFDLKIVDDQGFVLFESYEQFQLFAYNCLSFLFEEYKDLGEQLDVTLDHALVEAEKDQFKESVVGRGSLVDWLKVAGVSSASARISLGQISYVLCGGITGAAELKNIAEPFLTKGEDKDPSLEVLFTMAKETDEESDQETMHKVLAERSTADNPDTELTGAAPSVSTDRKQLPFFWVDVPGGVRKRAAQCTANKTQISLSLTSLPRSAPSRVSNFYIKGKSASNYTEEDRLSILMRLESSARRYLNRTQTALTQLFEKTELYTSTSDLNTFRHLDVGIADEDGYPIFESPAAAFAYFHALHRRLQTMVTDYAESIGHKYQFEPLIKSPTQAMYYLCGQSNSPLKRQAEILLNSWAQSPEDCGFLQIAALDDFDKTPRTDNKLRQQHALLAIREICFQLTGGVPHTFPLQAFKNLYYGVKDEEVTILGQEILNCALGAFGDTIESKNIAEDLVIPFLADQARDTSRPPVQASTTVQHSTVNREQLSTALPARFSLRCTNSLTTSSKAGYWQHPLADQKLILLDFDGFREQSTTSFLKYPDDLAKSYLAYCNDYLEKLLELYDELEQQNLIGFTNGPTIVNSQGQTIWKSPQHLAFYIQRIAQQAAEHLAQFKLDDEQPQTVTVTSVAIRLTLPSVNQLTQEKEQLKREELAFQVAREACYTIPSEKASVVSFIEQLRLYTGQDEEPLSGVELVQLLKERFPELKHGDESRLVEAICTGQYKASTADVVQNLVKEHDLPDDLLYFALVSMQASLDGQQVEDSPLAFSQFQLSLEEPKSQRVARSERQRKPSDYVVELLDTGSDELIAENYNHTYRGPLFRERFSHVFKYLFYRHHHNDTTAIISELEECKADLDSTEYQGTELRKRILSNIFDALIEQFEAIRNLQDPKYLKLSPTPEQKEALAGALYLDKPIANFGCGGGKTLIGAAYMQFISQEAAQAGLTVNAELREEYSEKTLEDIEKLTRKSWGLWCTKSGNVASTVKKLRKTVSSDISVAAIGPKQIHITPQELEDYITKHNIVVVGYETLREIAKKPDNFAVLQRMLKVPGASLVLDEVQVIDNWKSQVSQAVQALPCKNKVLLTGTPYQDNQERGTATLLKISFPEHPQYADVEQFYGLLKSKKSEGLARNLFRKHATQYTTEDLGTHFEDPEVTGVCLADQLQQQFPRLPRRRYNQLKVELSEEFTVAYIEINFFIKEFHAKYGLKPSQRSVGLRRLYSEPQKLGLGPPTHMINQVKDHFLDIHANSNGKAFFVGHRLVPLKELHQDPEMQKLGALYIDGLTPPTERTGIVSLLEEDPDHQLLLGNITAAGTADDMRTVANCFVFDSTNMTAPLEQALGRPTRLLFPGDEGFAHSVYVDYWFITPVLNQKVVEEYKDPTIRAALQGASKYDVVYERTQRKLKAMQYFMSRSSAQVQKSSKQLEDNLRQGVEEIADEYEQHLERMQRLGIKQVAEVTAFQNVTKNAWRRLGVRRFLELNLKQIKLERKQVHVAFLQGIHAEETKIYLENGIPNRNIHTFENKRHRQAEVKLTAENQGINFHPGRMQDILPNLPDSFSIVHYDPDGVAGLDTFQMFMDLRLSDSAIVMKNTMVARFPGRDNHQAWNEANRSILYLDAVLLKLSGTQFNDRFSCKNLPDTLKTWRSIRKLAKQLAKNLAAALESDIETVTEFLTELSCGSRHLRAYEQIYYRSPKGTPFLSTFTRSNAWSAEFAKLEALVKLHRLINNLVVSNKLNQDWSFIDSAVAEARDSFLVFPSDIETLELKLRELKQLFKYWTEQVAEKYRFKALVKSSVPKLEVSSLTR